MNLFIKALFCIMFACAVVEAQNVCETPIKESGKCVPQTQCFIHANIQKNGQTPLSSFMENYLMKSLCEVANGVRFVCCASRHIISENTDSSADDSSEMQPDDDRIIMQERGDFEDVVGHPSLSLVNQANCGRLSENKVSNGNNSGLGEFPWVVQLQYQTPNGLAFRCGGSLISKRYVLTAAHCVTKIRDPVVSVRLGEYDTSKDIDCSTQNHDYCLPPVQDIPIEEIKFHPEFNNPKFANDIAVLRLARDAKINDDSVLPICLPTTPDLQNNDLARVTIAGWGLTEDQKASNILQNAVIPVLPNEKCQQLYKRTTQVTSRQICAGGENRVDSCRGDSGGPLFFWGRIPSIRFVQYGVVSAGFGDCGGMVTYPGIYARVPYYMKWILDQMRP